MFELLRARRGRKAAVAVITPQVDASRHRLAGIPDAIWLEPYVVGFITALITLVARQAVGSLSGTAMGLVQADAWAEITGLDAGLIGEEICLLSSMEDLEFAEGCRSASAFFAAHADKAVSPDGGADLAALWSALFDSRIDKGLGERAWMHIP